MDVRVAADSIELAGFVMVLEVSLVRIDIFTTPLPLFFIFELIEAHVCDFEIATDAIRHSKAGVKLA